MENETTSFFTKNYFRTSFNKEDVSNLPMFKKWLSLQEKEGKTVVRCPHCWGYEIFIIPSNHRCIMCRKLYCQKCLKPCVENEVIHDHERREPANHRVRKFHGNPLFQAAFHNGH